jgi:hypothetical protein
MFLKKEKPVTRQHEGANAEIGVRGFVSICLNTIVSFVLYPRTSRYVHMRCNHRISLILGNNFKG